MTTHELMSNSENHRQPSDRELALDELENVSAGGGKQASSGKGTSRSTFLEFNLEQVFVTSV